MTSNQEWMAQQIPHLDIPETLIPEMNCCVRNWDIDTWADAVKMCLVSPTPYEAMIANLGIAIIYDMLNNRMDGTLCERFYFPESKLNRRWVKSGRHFFSKETHHNLKDFDILGFSTYFPLQFLIFPEILERCGMSAFTKERHDDTPLVMVGGCAAFASEPVYDMVDIIFVGQAEEGIKDVIKLIRKYKGQKGWKHLVKKEACSIKGVYVPEFYSETFYPVDHPTKAGQIKSIEVREEFLGFAPPVITKASIDLKKHEPVTKILIGNSEGLTMAAGALPIATGCSNRCFFCNGSFTCAPYRERDVKDVEEGFEKILKDTGTTTLTPFSFNLSDFSCINELIFWSQEEANRRIGMSTQRIDYFDHDFAEVARFTGHRTITLAIEAGSERMRAVINKNIIEADILKAFRTAFEVGFTGIKVYMISCLPFEKPEDASAIIELFDKILAIRDEVGSSCRIRVSYTPFQAKNHTPFQWAAPYRTFTKEDIGRKILIKAPREGESEYKIIQPDDVGMPHIDRSLTPVVRALADRGIPFRASAEPEQAVINQALCLGDRRMSRVIYDCYKEKIFVYRGGMSVGKFVLKPFENILKRYGLSFKFIFREKDEDEIFSWDNIHSGITKKFLLESWRLARYQSHKAIDGTKITDEINPFDKYFSKDVTCGGKRKHGGIPPCWVGCSHCGCCDKDSKVAKINRPDHSKDISLEDFRLELGRNLEKRKTKYVMFVHYHVYDSFRWVHNSKLKMHLRKAAMRLDLPLITEFSIASDNIIWQNWVSGIDVAEFMLYDKIDMSPEEIVEKLNYNLWNIKVVNVRIIESKKSVLHKSMDSAFFYTPIPRNEFAKLNISKALDNLSKDSFIIRVKIKGSSRWSLETEDYDIKSCSRTKLWFQVPPLAQVNFPSVIWSILPKHITPLDVLPKLFATKKRKFMVYPTRRVAYFQNKTYGELDMFAKVCDTCYNEIETTLFNQSITESHCAEHWGLVDASKPSLLQNLFQLGDCGQLYLSP